MSTLTSPRRNAFVSRAALRFFAATFLGVALAMTIAMQANRLALRVGGAELILIGAGFLEGLVAGAMQWTALREHLPAGARRPWLLASSLGVGLAWALGIVFFRMIDRTELPSVSSMYRALAVLALLGGLVGASQWVVLGKRFGRGVRWLAANALASCLSIVVILAGAAQVAGDPTNPALGLVAFLMQLVGLVVGATVLAAAFASMLAPE